MAPRYQAHTATARIQDPEQRSSRTCSPLSYHDLPQKHQLSPEGVSNPASVPTRCEMWAEEPYRVSRGQRVAYAKPTQGVGRGSKQCRTLVQAHSNNEPFANRHGQPGPFRGRAACQESAAPNSKTPHRALKTLCQLGGESQSTRNAPCATCRFRNKATQVIAGIACTSKGRLASGQPG